MDISALQHWRISRRRVGGRTRRRRDGKLFSAVPKKRGHTLSLPSDRYNIASPLLLSTYAHYKGEHTSSSLVLIPPSIKMEFLPSSPVRVPLQGRRRSEAIFAPDNTHNTFPQRNVDFFHNAVCSFPPPFLAVVATFFASLLHLLFSLLSPSSPSSPIPSFLITRDLNR